MKEKKHTIPVKRLVASGLLILTAAAGILSARFIDGFADFYGSVIYPVYVGIFARISGIFPFSVAEIMIIIGVLLVISGIVYFIVGMVKKKGQRRKYAGSFFSTFLLILSSIFFSFVYGMGINYSRRPFSETLGIKTERYTKQQVREVLEYTISKLSEAGKALDTDSAGNAVIPEDLSSRAVKAMKNLGQKYSQLNTYYSGVKYVMMSELMAYSHISGIFTFYSMEANISTVGAPEEFGHSACHELSHMSGFMREDEANYIAFLACRESGDPYLTYSGWYDMTAYMLNAYYSAAGYEEYAEIYASLPEYTIIQYNRSHELWKKYETDFGEVAEVMNDVYLKINDQSDGVRSYGRVVDLMIADYYAEK